MVPWKVGSTKHDKAFKFWQIGLIAMMAASFMLASCAPSAPASPTATATEASSSPVPVATATSEPTATTQALSFQASVYRDDVAGFEFDYPANWTVGPIEQYSRGGITAFTSWSRPDDVLPDETPAGETRLDVTVQLWDPVNDLDAFVQQRRRALEGSGMVILSQETWALTDGRAAEVFVLEAGNGYQAFYFFSTIGEKYLVLSGDGDLVLLAEIAGTVRGIEGG
jgi:hypothetical protein